MRSTILQIVLALAAAGTADAKPRRVVVLDFDGARELADTGRNTVMSLLGEQYDVVASKRWESARAQAQGHGTQQWQQAARAAGVDAIIEGWVQDEGRHHIMTVVVRDASTGNEVDSVTVKLGEHGVSTENGHQLAASLDEVMQWIDGDPTAATTHSELPEVHIQRPLLGARLGGRDHFRDRDRDDDDGEDDSRDRDRDRRHHHDRDDRDDRDSRDSRDSRDRDSDRDRDDHRDSDRDSDKDKDREKDKDADRDDADRKPKHHKEDHPKVALDADTSDLVTLFGPDSKEAAIVSDNKTVHVPKPTPRFMISAGGYMASRGISFDQDPNAQIAGPEYPASDLKGVMVQAAVYPLPVKKMDGGLSGIGFTFSIAKSVGSVLTAMDNTGYGDYVLDQTAWELGIHYRWPLDIVTIDAEVNYGSDAHIIEDLPQDIELPDTNVTYLGAGGHVDLHVTDRSSIGFGAKYMYVLDAGDIMSEDWYGAGGASGLTLDGDFIIPLPDQLFVKGMIEWRRISYDFEGSGTLAQQFGMWDAVDSQITASAQLGVLF